MATDKKAAATLMRAYANIADELDRAGYSDAIYDANADKIGLLPGGLALAQKLAPRLGMTPPRPSTSQARPLHVMGTRNRFSGVLVGE
jgi:hypothetical protein